MSEYRNDPTIDFMLDKKSKDYANRYDQHIHAMTAERLNAKSDIAWELTIRDQRIAELEEQNKRLVELVSAARDAETAYWSDSAYLAAKKARATARATAWAALYDGAEALMEKDNGLDKP